ncbi:MAG TPA: HEAT repeat domain-containing protein, partial [Vicinamibacterales bacterium]|nr:HEAT repeat domain-containing protein [Vicinamibacterales bacterium]
MFTAPAWRRAFAASFIAFATLAVASCASAPPPPPSAPAPVVPALSIFDQKMSWILGCEDRRVLKDPDVASADLVELLADREARIRRRAALAVGRVGLAAGVPALVDLLKDADPEVRQMAAFAIGLIGDRSGRDSLIAVLGDPSPLVQGSAAEALGLIGDPSAADAVGKMVAAIVQSGAVAQPPSPADEARPDTPAAAFRLGVFALVRLKAYDQLAAAIIDAGGKPKTTWWPVAFALQRMEDRRGLAVLQALARDADPYTRAYAVKGLGALKDRGSVPMMLPLLTTPDTGVQVEAIRALGKIGDAVAAAPLLRIVQASGSAPMIRLEAVTALGGIRAPGVVDAMVDLLGDRDPLIRAAALKSASSMAPDDFILILSGLDPDSDWHVRASLASLLGTLPRQSALPRLNAMLSDTDQRVIAAVLSSLVKLNAPGIGDILLDQLKSEDPVVRATAATGIGELRLPAGAQALPAAYQFALRDSSYVARAAILEAFSKYGISVSRSLLDVALADKDWAVRVRAAVLLRESEPQTNADVKIRPAPTRLAAEAYRSRSLTDPQVSTQAFIDTDRGTVQIELAVLDAPLTVDNFITLVKRGFYTGLTFHRVVPDFVVQGGDPRGDGEGGPGYTVRDELSERPYLRGTVGIALDWRDTGGSQFFITHSPQPHLDAKYTVLGRVVDGMDVVDRIQQNDVIRRIRVWDGQQMIG